MAGAEATSRFATSGDLSHRAMKAPLLGEERERALIARFQIQQDRAALDELILAHLRMVVSQANRYRNNGLPLSDLIQEGAVGLMEAAARFDPQHEVRFSTYAIWWIRAAIQAYVLRNWSVVRIGTTRAEKRLFFNLRRLRSSMEQKSPELPPSELTRLLARELDTTPEAIDAIDGRICGRDRSANEPLGEESDTELQDMVMDHRPNPEEQAIAHLDGAQRSRWLDDAISDLPDREQMIIRRRHLRDDAETLESISEDLGVSKERVRQLEKRALGRIRKSLEAHLTEPNGVASGNQL